jgi:Zn-dependent protease
LDLLGGLFSRDGLLLTLYILPGLILGLTFHEFCHAAVAVYLGDPTPRHQKRLTLNPLAHMDPIGMIAIVLLHFGWAKPVMINPNNFRKPRRDDMLVSVAGPVSNLVLASLMFIILKLLPISYMSATNNDPMSIFGLIVYYAFFFNIVLFVFNLIPIPPLDGYHVARQFIPYKYYDKLAIFERYSIYILLGIIILFGNYIFIAANYIASLYPL